MSSMLATDATCRVLLPSPGCCICLRYFASEPRAPEHPLDLISAHFLLLSSACCVAAASLFMLLLWDPGLYGHALAHISHPHHGVVAYLLNC